jgi:predicted MFS family arabinose efflux permease
MRAAITPFDARHVPCYTDRVRQGTSACCAAALAYSGRVSTGRTVTGTEAMTVSTTTGTPAQSPSRLAYGAFGLLNLTIGGIAALVLPLFAGDARLAGIAGALVNLGIAVGAPIAAALSRRFRATAVLAVSLGGAALAFLALSVPQPILFLGATVLFGLFSAAGLTLGTLFVMGWYARPQWDAQVGWLQTWMGAGQVLGLGVAGVVSGRLSLAVVGAAALALAGLWVLRLPSPAPTDATAAPAPHLRQAARTEVAGPLHGHHLAAFGPAHWPILRDRGLLWFLVPWALANAGSAPIFAFYPLLMHQRFGLTTSQSAWGYAGAALLGTGLYEVAGWLSRRASARVVLLASYLARGLALAGIAAALVLGGTGAWAMLSFVLVVGSWSFLSVAGNIRCIEVAPSGGTGSAMGAFYAITMLAKVAGALLGGVLVGRVGYAALLVLSAILLGGAGAWTAGDLIRSGRGGASAGTAGRAGEAPARQGGAGERGTPFAST